MGINIGTATFLCKSDIINSTKKNSNDPTSCKLLMMGRQTMSTQVSDYEILNSYNSSIRENSITYDAFSEDFLYNLGATIVESLDHSDFESAEIIHNLNKAFDSSKINHLKNTYDVVLDFGTSEHVFQPTQSIANAISLLKVGGRLNLVLPVCGWLEHGFYQFSPNFFRSMDGKYLELCQMYIFEPYSGSLQIWNAKELTNCTYYENLKGRYLCWAVYTKKSEFDEIDFLENTQQGVYKRAWDNTETDLTKLRESMSVFSKFKNDALKKYAFLKRYYMKSKRINVHEIGKL